MWDIRDFTPEDAASCAQIFYDAVHLGTKEYYSPQQQNAWASQIPETGKWSKRLLGQQTLVAHKGKKSVGFMTLASTGYIDLAFVAPQYTGQGVGRYLYQSIEQRARQAQLPRLHTQASRAAKPFFEKMGWIVLAAQIIKRGSVDLQNYQMEKQLPPHDPTGNNNVPHHPV